MLRRRRCVAIWMLSAWAGWAPAADPAVDPGSGPAATAVRPATEVENLVVPPPVLVAADAAPPSTGEPLPAEPAVDVGTEIVPLADAPPLPTAAGIAARAAEHGQAYVIAEAVFLQRDDQSLIQPLAFQGDETVLATGRMRFPTQPGLRLFVGAVNEQDAGWEVGYLGVWNMFASRTVTGPDDLLGPEPLSLLVPEFNDRAVARSTYAATLNSLEVNVFSRTDDGGFCRSAPQPWRRCAGYGRGTFDWLAGFRWAGLDEAAGLTFSGGANPLPGVYDLRSTTHLFGGQLGGRGRIEWERWAIEGWAKAALCGSALAQSQDPIVDAAVPDPPIRPARSAREGGVGFIGDLNATLVYRLTETWGLRAGYNLMWLSGVALAPNQFDFGAESTSGSGLNGGSGLFLHGASLGLEARW